MDLIAAWCGFLGAWVLVAGPIYQGAIELSDIKIDRKAVRSLADAVPRPERISPWWWLLPPVAYAMTRHRQNIWRQQIMTSLEPRKRSEFVTYFNKAASWFLVGSGAALIGIKETVELVETYDWPDWLALPLIAAAAAAALGFTVRRMHLSQRTLQAGDAGE